MTSEAVDFPGESTPVIPEVAAVGATQIDITSNESQTFTVPAAVTVTFNVYPNGGVTVTGPGTVALNPAFGETDCHFDANGHCAKCGY